MKIKTYFYKKLNPINYKKLSIHTNEETNNFIYNSLMKNEPFYAGRFGFVECEATNFQMLQDRFLIPFPKSLKYKMVDHAAIFSNDIKGRRIFKKYMIYATKQIDCLGTWGSLPGEGRLIKKYCRKDVFLGRLYGIHSFKYDLPWTKALAGKKILIVHPFEETIKSQYERNKLLFRDKNVLPDFTLITYKPIVTYPGAKLEYKTWEDGLLKMFKDISQIDFDIALVACGGYGMPLCGLIKGKLNKSVVHFGGALQLLFGIRGKRWEGQFDACDYSSIMNEHWVRPSQDETPVHAKKVENGCYW